MKQILSLALTLLPCLAYAQYPSNGNQKITLGEQTTADGLVFRGYATTDTVAATSKITRANKQDTSAFLLLDTVTNLLWHYKIGSNGWSQAGGSTFDTTTLNLVSRFAAKVNISDTASMLTPYIERGDTASMLTPYWRAGRFSGTLPVANGGTNTTTLTANKVMVGNGTSGVLTPTNLHWDNTNSRLGIGVTNPSVPFEVLRKSGSWVSFTDTLGKGFFSISNGTGSTSITYPIFNIQGSGNFGSNLTYGAAFVGYKDSLNSENTNDVVLYFDARKRKSNPLGVITKATNGSTFYFGNFGDPQLVIRADDKVGIATASPTEKLHVVGNARITAMNGIGDIGADANGVLQAATSDMNLKNTIENSPFGLNEILLLNPVTFLYNDTDRKIDSDVKEVGFIAQDVFDIIPNAVSSTGTGDLQLDYRAITATLTKAIQEQNLLIKALEQRIINLENK